MRVRPPDDIRGEALAEWKRIVSAIEDLGREVKPADRSILALYCRAYQINREMYAQVRVNGVVTVYPNGQPGMSMEYKAYIETSKQCRGLLSDLGCSPSSRDFDPPPEPEEQPVLVVEEEKPPEPPGALLF